MSDMKAVSTDGDKLTSDKPKEFGPANQAGQKRKDSDVQISQGPNAAKKAKLEPRASDFDDKPFDKALSDDELSVQVNSLKRQLAAQKGVNTKVNKALERKNEELAKLERRLTRIEAHYQRQLATKSRPDDRTTIMSVDHRQVVARVKKTFDGIRHFAQEWAVADKTLLSNTTMEEKNSLIKLITGASNSATPSTMCKPEVVNEILNHQRAGRVILEASLNHFAFLRILRRPFGFLSFMARCPENVDHSLEWIYRFTYKTSPMRAATWRSVLDVCLDTAEVPVAENNTQAEREIFAARSEWANSLCNSFLDSSCTHVFKKVEGREHKRMFSQLIRLFESIGYLATYLYSQGTDIVLRTWADISKSTFEISSSDMELHPTMSMYLGEVYDESSFQGRTIEFLVRPQLQVYGRDGKFFDDGRTVLKSCHWFVQSPEHIKQDSEPADEKKTSHNSDKCPTVAKSTAPKGSVIPLIHIEDTDTGCSEQPKSNKNLQSIQATEKTVTKNAGNRTAPPIDRNQGSDQKSSKQETASEEDTFGDKYRRKYCGCLETQRTKASGPPPIGPVEPQKSAQSCVNQSAQAPKLYQSVSQSTDSEDAPKDVEGEDGRRSLEEIQPSTAKLTN